MKLSIFINLHPIHHDIIDNQEHIVCDFSACTYFNAGYLS